MYAKKVTSKFWDQTLGCEMGFNYFDVTTNALYMMVENG